MKKRYKKAVGKQNHSIQKASIRKSLRHNLKRGVFEKDFFHKDHLNDLIENGNISTFDLYNILQRAYCGNSESSSTGTISYPNDVEQQNIDSISNFSDAMQQLRGLKSAYLSNLCNNTCQQKQTMILKPTTSYHSETNNRSNAKENMINFRCFEDHLNENSFSSDCGGPCCQGVRKYYRIYDKRGSF